MVDVKALAEIVDEAARRGVAVAQLTDMYPALSIETAYAVQADGGDVSLYSAKWRLLRPTSAKVLGALGREPARDDFD